MSTKFGFDTSSNTTAAVPLVGRREFEMFTTPATANSIDSALQLQSRRPSVFPENPHPRGGLWAKISQQSEEIPTDNRKLRKIKERLNKSNNLQRSGPFQMNNMRGNNFRQLFNDNITCEPTRPQPHRKGSIQISILRGASSGIRKTTDGGSVRENTPFSLKQTISNVRGFDEFYHPKYISKDRVHEMKTRISEWARITGIYKYEQMYNLPNTFRMINDNPDIFIKPAINTCLSTGEYCDTDSVSSWVKLDVNDAISALDRPDALEWMPIQTMTTSAFGLLIVYLNVVNPQKTNTVIIRTQICNWTRGPPIEMLTTYSNSVMINSTITRECIKDVEKYNAANALMGLAGVY